MVLSGRNQSTKSWPVHALGCSACAPANRVSCTVSCAPQVVRGVVLARKGLEVPVQQIASLQEGARLLPSDAYRACLSRVGHQGPGCRVAASLRRCSCSDRQTQCSSGVCQFAT
jgi:hypothetical protein